VSAAVRDLLGRCRRGLTGSRQVPSKKDLKRLVRARMAKTGESYTTARAHTVGQRLRLPPGYVRLAGISDDTLVENTGKSWRAWVAVLDEAGATEMSHGEIARFVRENYSVGSWWCQAVTVGYERIRALRTVGQGRDGYFTANKSRTLGLPAADVRRAVRDAVLRRQWLPETQVIPTGRGQAKDFRFRCPDGTRGVIAVVPRGGAKTSVVVAHEKLPTEQERVRRQTFWEERLEALRLLLSPA